MQPLYNLVPNFVKKFNTLQNNNHGRRVTIAKFLGFFGKENFENRSDGNENLRAKRKESIEYVMKV